MKKVFSKFINILLIISMVIVPNTAFALTEAEVKAGASKWDIYNPQTNTVGNSATVTASNGDVDVEKRVTKVNDTGLYNVSFWVKGKKTTSTITKDTYIVFVIDRSYTMKLNNRWVDARDAVIDISSELSKVKGIKMALVGFSGGKSSQSKPWDDTVTLRPQFSQSAFTSSEFGNYDTDNTHGGGTNIQGGLLKAEELLKGKKGAKYVVLLTDGVPTFYYDADGNTLGPGNSDTAEKLSQVPYCVNKTVEVANRLKQSATIYSIGYDYENLTHKFTYDGVKYDEQSLAFVTLTNTASPGKYYQASTSSNNTISNELNKIQEELLSFPAGSNPSVSDGIGSSFKLTTSNSYGGTKTLTTSDNFVIEEGFKKVGDFNIQIDTTVDTGWYDTNNSFTLSYNNPAGVTKTITSDKNPEVYWVNKYNYTVNYYKDAITNPSEKTHFINGYTDKADNGEVILKSDIDLNKYIPEGYYLEGIYNEYATSKIDSLTVDKNKNNIINILYKIKKFNYKVNYYYADLNNNYGKPEKIKTVGNVKYGTEVTTSSHYLKENEIRKGYSLDEEMTKEMTYKITKEGIVIDIYYKRNSYGYTVNYHFNNKFDESLTNNSSGIFGNKVYASNNYLEDVNSEGLLNKNILDNTNYFLEPGNLNNISDITIGDNPLLNILNLYYASTGFVNETITKDANLDVITSSNTPVTYTVNYDSVINNVRKDEVVNVVVVDKLPNPIDTSNLMTNLNGGIYDEDNLTITWIFTETANDFTKVYNVSKDIEYTVVYKDYADISSSKDNTLVNTVSGVTTVGNITTRGVRDTDNIDVEIKGKVIVNYITKDGNKLTDSIIFEDFVGADYKTDKKKFDKYSFIELKGNSEGKFIEGVIEVTYVYDLTPLPPKTGVEENSSLLFVKYVVSFIGLVAVEEVLRRKFN